MIYKEEWKKCKLGDIAKIQGGYPFKSSDFTNTGNIVLKIKNVQKGKINLEDCGFVNNNIAASAKDYLLGNEDILICMTGSSPNAPASVVGRVALFKKKQYGICLINQRIGRFVINEKIANKRFVYYLFSQEKTLQWLVNNSSGSANQANISNKTIENYEFNIPPLDIQQKIAKVLSAIDDKIELNNSINNNLEQQAQAIFKSWFVDFEPFGGTMPENWSYIQLSDLATFVGGYSYKGTELQTSNCAMATIKNFDRNGGFKLDGFKEIIPSEKLKISQEVDLFDILVAHTDLTQNAEVIGNAELLLSKLNYKKIIFSMDLVKVVPNKGISKFLLATLLKSKLFKSHCLGYVNGTTVLHLSKKALPEYSFAFPNNIEGIKNISSILESMYIRIANNINENMNLTQLRDTLLPKLMSGEIDVSKVEIDNILENQSADKLLFSEDK